MIPFFDFNRKYKRYQASIHDAITRVLQRGWFILGPELQDFETAFAHHHNAKHAIGVNSGTDAIFLALKALGVTSDHEIITVPNTAVPTVSAIRMTGASPVFVDVNPKTHVMDAALLEKSITKKTRVIIPVHLYGYPAPLGEILRIAKKHKLFLLEDVAQAQGGKYNGRALGTIGDVGCFSFYPTKNLGAFGDAGAIITNNSRLAKRLRALRNYGEIAKFHNAIEGTNSRLDELQAAILSDGLKHVDEWNAQRARLARAYFQGLKNVPVELPEEGNDKEKRVWHLFVIRTERRDELQKFLLKSGIQTMIHYPKPIQQQVAYRFLRYKKNDLPVASRLSKQILSLPIYPELTLAETSRICTVIAKFFDANPK